MNTHALRWFAVFIIMALLALAFSSIAAGEDAEDDVDTMPIFPLVVNGTAYDQYGQFIVGASVLIVSYNDTGVKICSKYTVTDVDGYYSVTFGQNEWMPGGIMEAILSFEGTQETETVTVADVPVITMDFHILYEISEFGGSIGLILVILFLIVVAIILIQKFRMVR